MFDNIVIDLPFIISVFLNLTLVILCGIISWYCVSLLKKLYFIRDTVDAVNNRTGEFLQHLEHINSLDTYYGDQNIMALITHCKELTKFIEEYKLSIIDDELQYEPELKDDEESEEE